MFVCGWVIGSCFCFIPNDLETRFDIDLLFEILHSILSSLNRVDMSVGVGVIKMMYVLHFFAQRQLIVSANFKN